MFTNLTQAPKVFLLFINLIMWFYILIQFKVKTTKSVLEYDIAVDTQN